MVIFSFDANCWTVIEVGKPNARKESYQRKYAKLVGFGPVDSKKKSQIRAYQDCQ